MGVSIEMNFVDLDVYSDLVTKKLGWDRLQVEQHCRKFGPVLRTEDGKRRVLVLLNDEYHDGDSPYYNLSHYLCYAFGVSEDDKIGEGEETYGNFLFDLVLHRAEGERYYDPLLIGASLNLFDRDTEPDPDDFEGDEEE